MVPTPDRTPDTDDPGDETARRFRFQYTYAAVACCSLLDETHDAQEVFCEHHEDVLLKHKDGFFSGLQIKTRASDQDVWKANDETLIGVFVRFATLESEFPGQFKAFRFLTNHPLYAAANGRDICHILSEIRSTLTRAGITNRAVNSFIKKIANEAGCSEEVAFTALRRSSATDELPKLADVQARLVHALTQVWDRAADCSHSAVSEAAVRLINECSEASSLASEGLLPAYVPMFSGQTDHAGRIAAKRFDRERVLECLERGLNGIEFLASDPINLVTPGAGSSALLEAKLEAGGFSAVSVNSAKDLRDKAEYLGIVWTKKFGRETGLQRYTHIRSIVLHDAALTFEETKCEEGKFGVAMLQKLRERFARRRREGGLPLHECSDEHLIGFAHSLTSECQVYWSLKRHREPGR